MREFRHRFEHALSSDHSNRLQAFRGDRDSLGRSTRELLDLISASAMPRRRFDHGDSLWDTGSSRGRLLSTLLAAIAEFEGSPSACMLCCNR
jgi:hypothetical protein